MSTVFADQVSVIWAMNMAYPMVNVEIVRSKCGERNAYYKGRKHPGLKTPQIVLCTEMDEFPMTAVFFAAHEMAHAITDHYTDTVSESDADELAALAMIALGLETELFVASVYWLQKDRLGHIPGDDHLPAGYRAWYLACLQEGATEEGSDECKTLYRATDMKWARRLSVPIETPAEITVDDLLNLLKNPFQP